VETIGKRIVRLRTAKGWTRPELGRQMAKAVSKKKPFSGELIRLYETDTNRPSPDARRALAKVFDRTEQYIEFGDAPQSESKVKQAAAEYRVSVGVSEEALEIARAFDQMQPQARAYIREQVFIYTVIDKSFPWLRHGQARWATPMPSSSTGTRPTSRRSAPSMSSAAACCRRP
jgi:transcriptional regulator with XRE-family HTH domain